MVGIVGRKPELGSPVLASANTRLVAVIAPHMPFEHARGARTGHTGDSWCRARSLGDDVRVERLLAVACAHKTLLRNKISCRSSRAKRSSPSQCLDQSMLKRQPADWVNPPSRLTTIKL